MSEPNEPNSTDFERRARAVLEAGTDRLDGRVRSKLTQARYAALAALEPPATRAAWSRWMPAGAVAATVLVAFVALVNRSPDPNLAPTADRLTAFDDLEILADGDEFEFADLSDDYAFYEWASVVAEESTDAIGT
jgi:negative regulator of sigma E activity